MDTEEDCCYYSGDDDAATTSLQFEEGLRRLRASLSACVARLRQLPADSLSRESRTSALRSRYTILQPL